MADPIENGLFKKSYEVLGDLPAFAKAPEIVKALKEGKGFVFSSETGSGKTLTVAPYLADSFDGLTIVIVPKRILAQNAAETIAKISGLQVGNEVGYAVGSRGGENISLFNDQTKLIFTTPAMATASGLINEASNIFIDEAHETHLTVSIAKALIHNRLSKGHKIRFGELSATIDTKENAKYWEDQSEVALFHSEGKTFSCNFTYQEAYQNSHGYSQDKAKAVFDLLKKGKKGIVIFEPGKREIANTINAINALAEKEGLKNLEVKSIHGQTSQSEQNSAKAPPLKGNAKIIVGTDVIESGVNIPWLDSGISSGLARIPQYDDLTGAESLLLSEIPKWRITQQLGRTNRFTESDFILFGGTKFEHRKLKTTPEILRAPLEKVVMECYAMKLDPIEIKFDADIPNEKFVRAIERLELLGLVENKKLTQAGHFVRKLRVGPEAGAMLWEARNQGTLQDAIELAAVVEAENLRKDWNIPHGKDNSSDILDGLKAYKEFRSRNTGEIRNLKNNERNKAREQLFKELNLSPKKYFEVKEAVADLKERLGHEVWRDSKAATDDDLKAIILSGSFDRIYFNGESLATGQNYSVDKNSVIRGNKFSVGGLRKIKTRRGQELTFLQQGTEIPDDIIYQLLADRKSVFGNPIFERDSYGDSFILTHPSGTKFKLPISKNPSLSLEKLIEPEYSRFTLERDSENLTKSLGFSETNNLNALINSDSLQDVANKLNSTTGLPINLLIKDLNQEDNTDSTNKGKLIISNKISKFNIDLEIQEQSLNIQQVLKILKTYPMLTQPNKYNRQVNKTHAYEIRDDALIIHSADNMLWRDEKIDIISILQKALNKNQKVIFQEAKVINIAETERNYFSAMLNQNNHYTIEEKKLAESAINAFNKSLLELRLTNHAHGEVQYAAQYNDNIIMIAEEQYEKYSLLSDELKNLEKILTSQMQERAKELQVKSAAYDQIKTAISGALSNNIYFEDVRSFSDNSLQIIKHENFFEQVKTALIIREQIDLNSSADLKSVITETKFYKDGVIKIWFKNQGSGNLNNLDLVKNIEVYCEERDLGFAHNCEKQDDNHICVVVAGPNHSLSMQDSVSIAEIQEVILPKIEILEQHIAEHTTKITNISDEKIALSKIKAEEREEAKVEHILSIKEDIQFIVKYDLPCGSDLLNLYLSVEKKRLEKRDPELKEYLYNAIKNVDKDRVTVDIIKEQQTKLDAAIKAGAPSEFEKPNFGNGSGMSDVYVITKDGKLRKENVYTKISNAKGYKLWHQILSDELVISWQRNKHSPLQCDFEVDYIPESLTLAQKYTVEDLTKSLHRTINFYSDTPPKRMGNWDLKEVSKIPTSDLEADIGRYEYYETDNIESPVSNYSLGDLFGNQLNSLTLTPSIDKSPKEVVPSNNEQDKNPDEITTVLTSTSNEEMSDKLEGLAQQFSGNNSVSSVSPEKIAPTKSVIETPERKAIFHLWGGCKSSLSSLKKPINELSRSELNMVPFMDIPSEEFCLTHNIKTDKLLEWKEFNSHLSQRQTKIENDLAVSTVIEAHQNMHQLDEDEVGKVLRIAHMHDVVIPEEFAEYVMYNLGLEDMGIKMVQHNEDLASKNKGGRPDQIFVTSINEPFNTHEQRAI